MDVTWTLRPGVQVARRRAHTSADVKFTVDAINKGDWKPESTDGFDRISGVDTPDSLTAVVHYREIYAPYQLQFLRGTLPKHLLEGRDIDTRERLQPRAAGHRSVPRGRVEDRGVHAAGAGAGLLARRRRREDPAPALPLPDQHDHAHQPARARRGAPGRARAVGQGARAARRAGAASQHACSATATSTSRSTSATSRRSPTCACGARSPTRSTAS